MGDTRAFGNAVALTHAAISFMTPSIAALWQRKPFDSRQQLKRK